MFTDQRGQSFWERRRAPNRCREQTRGGYNWTRMKLPTRCLLRISLARVWFELEGANWSLIGTSGPTSIQRVTRHKNTLISSRCRNTTYSPEKEDPPGTQCTKSPWSSHSTCSHSQFWGVYSDDVKYFPPWPLLIQNVKQCNFIFVYCISVLQVKCLFTLDFVAFCILTIQPTSSGSSSGLFLCIIWGSNVSQVLQNSNSNGNYILHIYKHSSVSGRQALPMCHILHNSWVLNTWSNRPNFGYSSSGSLLPGSGCSFTRKTSRSLLWKIKQYYYYIITVIMPHYVDPCEDFLHKVVKKISDCVSPPYSTTLPLSSLCCWARWASPVSDELSCTPSICQWTVWYPAERNEKHVSIHDKVSTTTLGDVHHTLNDWLFFRS